MYLDEYVTTHRQHMYFRVGYIVVSGMVHTRVEVCRIDSEMSRLVKQPWLLLMCCTACLLCGHNFR